MAGNCKDRRRSVIGKVSAILRAMTVGGPNTLTEIATRAELPLSTVHRLASELTAWGVLERDDDGRYRAGTPLRALGYEGGLPTEPEPGSALRECVAPLMEDLFRATGLPVRAGNLVGCEVAYIQKVSAGRPVSLFAAAARLPPHATGLGKVLMAFSPPAAVDAILVRGLTSYTPNTITCPERLRGTLRTIRRTRIAIGDEELERGWCGVAAPVFGPGRTLLAALELCVPAIARPAPDARALVTVAAAGLSRELTTLSRAQQPHTPATAASGAVTAPYPGRVGPGWQPALDTLLITADSGASTSGTCRLATRYASPAAQNDRRLMTLCAVDMAHR